MFIIRAEYFSTFMLTLASLCGVWFITLNFWMRQWRLLEMR